MKKHVLIFEYIFVFFLLICGHQSDDKCQELKDEYRIEYQKSDIDKLRIKINRKITHASNKKVKYFFIGFFSTNKMFV